MKKGFIFSMDAALALIVVMTAVTLLTIYFQAADMGADAFSTSSSCTKMLMAI